MKPIDKFKNKATILYNEFMELKDDTNISIKHSIDFKGKTLIVRYAIIDRKLVWTRGSSNKTKDGYFIPYFDWDNLKESYVKEQALILQEQFDLGDLLIFKSSENSYQGVGFVKLTLHKLQEVLMHSSCDYAFIQFPKYLPYAKYYILRQFAKGNTKKPKYLYTLNRNTNKQQSFAHWKWFNILYPNAKINKLKNSDNLGDLIGVDYPTGTNI